MGYAGSYYELWRRRGQYRLVASNFTKMLSPFQILFYLKLFHKHFFHHFLTIFIVIARVFFVFIHDDFVQDNTTIFTLFKRNRVEHVIDHSLSVIKFIFLDWPLSNLLETYLICLKRLNRLFLQRLTYFVEKYVAVMNFAHVLPEIFGTIKEC